MTKGCYTCRRRRIICDNGLPTCRKCRDAGKECLGYQKPLIWVKGGVASRGKMMGLSFCDVMENPRRERRNQLLVVDNLITQSPSDSVVTTTRPGSDWLKQNNETGGIENADFYEMQEDDESDIVLGPSGSTLAEWENRDNAIMLRATGMSNHHNLALSRGLVDPLFKDMTWISRFFISHFSQQCAPDLALYDTVKNPYRDLIPLIQGSPVLTNSLAAVGALHHAYNTSNNGTLSIPMTYCSEMVSGAVLPLQSLNDTHPSFASQWATSKSYEHFLRLKQKALCQLSANISDPNRRNDDRTVAAILVLILVDAMESGSDSWKYHLEGAKNLLKSRQAASEHVTMIEMIEGLDAFVIDSCLIMEIMGATLARPGALSRPLYSQSMSPVVLERLEKTSWVGCPAYLLDVIFFVNALRYSETQFPVESSYHSHAPSGSSRKLRPLKSPEELLRHIQAFDPVTWSEEMQTFLYLADLSKRVALASAYKVAVYLYTRRVLSKSEPRMSSTCPTADRIVDHNVLVNELINHLSLIGPDDPHFKCTIWITFIVGAESKYTPQRIFTLEKLNALWDAISSVNVQNAACVLKIMWQRQDDRHRRQGVGGHVGSLYQLEPDKGDICEEEEEFDWIQELDQSRTDWLFI